MDNIIILVFGGVVGLILGIAITLFVVNITNPEPTDEAQKEK